MQRDCCAAYINRLLISPECEQCHVTHGRRVDREKRIARAEAVRLLQSFEPAFGLSACRKAVAEPGMAQRKTRIKLDCLREMHQRRLRAPPPGVRKAQHQLSPRVLIVKFDRTRTGIQRAFGEFVDWLAGV